MYMWRTVFRMGTSSWGEGHLDIAGMLGKTGCRSLPGAIEPGDPDDKYMRDPHYAMETSFLKVKRNYIRQGDIDYGNQKYY